MLSSGWKITFLTVGDITLLDDNINVISCRMITFSITLGKLIWLDDNIFFPENITLSMDIKIEIVKVYFRGSPY
jgi:hypothetical protein